MSSESTPEIRELDIEHGYTIDLPVRIGTQIIWNERPDGDKPPQRLETVEVRRKKKIAAQEKDFYASFLGVRSHESEYEQTVGVDELSCMFEEGKVEHILHDGVLDAGIVNSDYFVKVPVRTGALFAVEQEAYRIEGLENGVRWTLSTPDDLFTTESLSDVIEPTASYSMDNPVTQTE